jgi:hypothetical protein
MKGCISNINVILLKDVVKEIVIPVAVRTGESESLGIDIE